MTSARVDVLLHLENDADVVGRFVAHVDGARSFLSMITSPIFTHERGPSSRRRERT